MILYAVVYRLSDGLPLVGTTDISPSPQVIDCQKYIKTISKRLIKFQDRCVLHLEGFTILFISALGITFLMLCEESYPKVLAFCFLDEVQKEFIVRYDNFKVSSAKRPYAFIEYEPFLKKAKQRYNSPRTLSTRVNLADMSTELKLRPPHYIAEYEMIECNGRKAAYNEQSIPASISGRLDSVDWVTGLSAAVNIFCAFLNLIRGMAIISHGHYDDSDSGAYRFGTCFLAASLLSVYQVFLMVSFSRRKRLFSILVLLLLCVIQYLLQDFRNTFQITFHSIAALFASYVIWKGKSKETLPGYHV